MEIDDDRVVSAALQLAPEKRAELAAKLLASLPERSEPTETVWQLAARLRPHGDELEGVPADLSENIDDHLYGISKKPE